MSFGDAPLPTPVLIGLIALVALSVAEWLFHLLRLRQPSSPRRERLSFGLCVSSWRFAVVFSLLDAIWLHWTTVAPDLVSAGYAGVPLLAAGIAVRIISRWTLGKQFSGYVQTTEGHRLISSGIYRIIRHPAYLGYLCLLVGFPIAFGSIGGFVFAILVGIPSLAYRITVEEAALLKWFGQDYERYRQRTRKIVPWLW